MGEDGNLPPLCYHKGPTTMDWLLFKHKETSQMTIDINVEKGTILITQRWRMADRGNTSSTSIEYFKRMVVSTIQTIWNRRCFINLIDKNATKKEDRKKSFILDFKIRWVTSNEHWKVYMQSEGVSFINWIARTIHLDMLDIKPQQKLGAPRGLEQYPVAHEFGHTIGNVRGAFPSIIMGFNRMSIISHGDEYGIAPSIRNSETINRQRREYIADISSIMNVGNGLRRRHLDYILQELNSMCSTFFGCYFEIDEVIEV